MKFTKVVAFSIALLTITGAQAGWLDGLTDTSAATAPAQTETSGGWMDQLGGLFGQKPAPAPTQLGLPPVGSVSTQTADIGALRQNIAAIVAKVQEMVPALTTAITNKDFTSVAALAGPAKDLLTLGMSAAATIHKVVTANPQAKSLAVGLINQINPIIAPVVAQLNKLQADPNLGWFAGLGVKAVKAALEQLPQILSQAAQ